MNKIKQMANQNILITGISGQDGLFLTNLILSNKISKFNIYGITRKNSVDILNNLITLGTTTSNLNIVNINLSNPTETYKLISQIKPVQIYNLSGPSSVYESLEKGSYYQDLINLIFNNLTKACIELKYFPAFFQACSSEMFSSTNILPLNEHSNFEPRSPYAEAKYEVFKKVNYLKEQFDWNIKSGIMFNHESEFRSKDFLFMKLFTLAKQIKIGELKNFELGSLELKRDWSFAGDVANAMYLINQSDKNINYVIGSGVSTSIQEVAEKIFSFYNLKLDDYVIVNPNLLRKDDPKEIVSDPSLLKSQLSWKSEYTIDKLLERMYQKLN